MKIEYTAKTKQIEPNKNDKRPIAKFYRSYLQDVERGLPEAKCRGINAEQYMAADRLSCSYERIFARDVPGYVVIDSKVKYRHTNYVEKLAVRTKSYRLVISQLNKNSRAIVEHVCIKEQPVRQYELEQVPQWVKGVGTARLREALDELIEIYHGLKM